MKKATAAATAVAVATAAVALAITAGVFVFIIMIHHRWQQRAPEQACQRSGTQVLLLHNQVMAHLLQLAVQPVLAYNADVEQKVQAIQDLGESLPEAIVHEGLNPGFRMTPPTLQDLQLVITLPPPVITAAQAGGGVAPATAACEAEFAVQVRNGDALKGTLSWQLLDGEPQRFAFEPSFELGQWAEQFGIDLNLPLYHLTHHLAKVRMGYYRQHPELQTADEAVALAYKDVLWERFGLVLGGVGFSVPTAPH